MQIGFHLADLTWRGGPPRLATTLAATARAAEAAGTTRLTVMDHLWQVGAVAGAQARAEPMLEAHTALGHLAAVTERVLLHTLVTSAAYRPPGLLAAQVATLDVLSGGRAGLGIGVGWQDGEAAGLGLPDPPLAERYDHLADALAICRQVWGSDDGPFDGARHHLGSTLTVPRPARQPFLLVAGAGPRRTLPLVARYADACNVGVGQGTAATLDALRTACQDAGRPYEAVEKTTMLRVDAATELGALLGDLRAAHGHGITTAYVWARNEEPLAAVDLLAGAVAEVAAW